jgi:hypothetical protein
MYTIRIVESQKLVIAAMKKSYQWPDFFVIP